VTLVLHFNTMQSDPIELGTVFLSTYVIQLLQKS